MRCEEFAVRGTQRIARQQPIESARDLLVVRRFIEEFREIRVSVRVEQSQPREMSLGPKLLRSRGEKQQSRRALGELLHERVLLTRRFRRPLQMMRLIDDEQVPAGCHRLPGAFRILREEADVANHELAVEKRVRGFIVLDDGFAAVLVENAEQ